jgi:UDP-N-acetylmuramoyl-tripeptide--D-alanyl-D-alanine ligase
MLTFDEAAKATGAHVEHTERAPESVIVSTDTRTLATGETYLALRGERFDGHEYIDEALRKGAAALVIERSPQAAVDVATLIVADTKAAYMSLASAARSKFHGRVIAITGSTGKTTTKVLLSQLLRSRYLKHVAASPSNENNEIGVSKLLLRLTNDEQAVVVEMGARHFGDIAALVEIARPHVGILTNVGEAHLEIMGSRERLAQTKWAIFSQGATAVLNIRDEVSRAYASQLAKPPRWFGLGAATLPELHQDERGTFLVDRHTMVLIERGVSRTYHLRARLPGDYNLENLAAALAGALELGCDPESLVGAVEHLELPSGRYESVDVSRGVRVIFDAYNASMSGMIATLDAFAQETGVRRIAVLGSMAELGPEAPQMHATVGEHAARLGFDTLLIGGDYLEHLADGALAAGFPAERIVRFRDNAFATAWLRAHAGAGEVVLLKGSRKYRLEEILEGLRA